MPTAAMKSTTPNAITVKAMHELRRGKLRRFRTVRALMASLLAVVALAPLAALAQVSTSTPASVSAGLLDAALGWLLSPTGLATAVGLVLSGVGLLVGGDVVRRRRVALAVYHAFLIVEDLRAEVGPGKLDKPLEGLKAADEWMKAHGWRELKPGEQAVAKLAFKAMNAQTDMALSSPK